MTATKAKRLRMLWLLGIASLVGGGLAAASAGLKEYARALTFFAAERPLPTGPLPVGRTTLALEAAWHGGTVQVDLWYPASASASPFAALARPTQARAAQDAPLAGGDARLPLVLYVPSWFARRDENTFTLANLASHGFVVAAMDDIQHHPPAPHEAQAAQEASLDYGSEAGFAASRRMAAERVRLAAQAAAAVADRLAAAPGWGERLATDRFAVLGFSFGGGVAAELVRGDARVVAAANLDGSVFGEAEQHGVDRPYLMVLADEWFSAAADPEAEHELERRFEGRLTREAIALQLRQAARPEHWTVVAVGAVHGDFTDRLLLPPFSALLAPQRPIDRMDSWTCLNAYLVAFFDRQLRGGRHHLLEGAPPLSGFRALVAADLPPLPDHPKAR